MARTKGSTTVNTIVYVWSIDGLLVSTEIESAVFSGAKYIGRMTQAEFKKEIRKSLKS